MRQSNLVRLFSSTQKSGFTISCSSKVCEEDSLMALVNVSGKQRFPSFIKPTDTCDCQELSF